MERKVGEIFQYKGKIFKIIQNSSCTACAFANTDCTAHKSVIGNCTKSFRRDNSSVIFRTVNNIEIKDNKLTIDIPEGMEIDIENSNLVNGVIKFKKRKLTYDDIFNSLSVNSFTGISVHKDYGNKLQATAQLMLIAKYYNGDWKPDWSNIKEYKYHILHNNNENIYMVDYNNTFTLSNIYFKNKEDAISVINNPNFIDILDTIYK